MKHFAPEAEKNKSVEQNLDDLRQASKELVVDFHQRLKKVVRLNQDPRMVKAFNEATTEEAKANCKLMLDIWKQSQVENYFRKGLRQEIKQILSSRMGMDTMTKMVDEAAQNRGVARKENARQHQRIRRRKRTRRRRGNPKETKNQNQSRQEVQHRRR